VVPRFFWLHFTDAELADDEWAPRGTLDMLDSGAEERLPGNSLEAGPVVSGSWYLRVRGSVPAFPRITGWFAAK